MYLSLFVCAKFAITIPYLHAGSHSPLAFAKPRPEEATRTGSSRSTLEHSTLSESRVLRSEAAAPPLYLLALALIPVAAATYIVSTRYTDYRHHGFDLIFGSLIGFTTSWVSFRWYHAPLRRGAGWSWGPRSKDKAWAVGLGVQGYAGDAEWKKSTDPETGLIVGPQSETEEPLSEGAAQRDIASP